MRARKTAAVLWLGCGLWYLAAEAIATANLPGYSYSIGYISDLGVPGHSPAAGWMNSGFVVQGIGFAVAGTLVLTTVQRSRATAALLVLAWIYGVGCVVVGVVHGGGTGAVRITHLAGATAAIAAGNVALIVVGVELLRRRLHRVAAVASIAVGTAGLVSAVILLQPGLVGTVPWDGGAWERGGVYSIILWQLVAAVFLLTRARISAQR